MQDTEVEGTLTREVNEETGIVNLHVDGLFGVTVANFKIHGGKDNLMFVVYKCVVPEGTSLKLSNEHSEYKWVTPFEAKTFLSFQMPKEFLERLD